jgi:asparagine synthase (glutamine-hydrolysing)
VCRLIGQINSNSEFVDVEHFKRLTYLSKAGGPDNTSFFIQDQLIFGFNRLSIIDLTSNGNQPVITPTGRYVVMMNGEIYNFKELISQYNLDNLRSSSDTEVVCHLIDKLGIEKSISILNGMFAISCWDIRDEILWLSRDFAGIKPLFYSLTAKGLIFASQFDQVFKHNWFKAHTWNVGGLESYFRLGYMRSPETIVENIFSLEPGETIRYNRNTNISEKKYFQRYFENSVVTAYGETKISTLERVENALKSVFADQMVSDAPIGVFLSGGVDSALVASIASRLNPNIKTLTIGFEDSQLDESGYAKSYASELGIQNENVKISNKLAGDLIAKHNDNLTEPLADFSCLPMYFASSIAYAKFKVMLSGDGGDELFWGYPRYKYFSDARFLYKMPSESFRKKIANLFYDSKVISNFKLSSETVGEANLKSSQLISHTQFQSLINQDVITQDPIKNMFDFDSISKFEILKYVQKNDFYGFLQKVLIKVDRVSMANSLEVRVPFLDKRILDIVEKINPKLGPKGNDLKFITKQILNKYINPSVIQTGKMGFTPPIGDWILQLLKAEIDDMVDSEKSKTLPIDYKYVRSNWLGIKNKVTVDFNLIWSFYILSKFIERMEDINLND